MVKCSECGFISARNTEMRVLEEIEEQSRQDGNIGKQRYVLIPVCFAHSFNIKEEATALWKYERDNMSEEKRNHATPEWPKYVRVILNTERKCDSFTNWQQEFTPKEHREMIHREARLKWQVEREEADRRWREQQEKWHSREEWRRYIFMAIITVVAVIIGVILGYFIK